MPLDKYKQYLIDPNFKIRRKRKLLDNNISETNGIKKVS